MIPDINEVIGTNKTYKLWCDTCHFGIWVGEIPNYVETSHECDRCKFEDGRVVNIIDSLIQDPNSKSLRVVLPVLRKT